MTPEVFNAPPEAPLGCGPVVIIGAARSGTNVLRDVLTSVESVVTWDCDEINYIWRHGNRSYPSDELTPAHATPRVRRYIRRAFARLARATEAAHVVEKTCANSVRVPFVDRVVPEARYVFIVRDGRDVVASAMKRWQTPVDGADLRYTLTKLRYMPLTDVPYYGARQLRNIVYRRWSREGRLAFWGPRVEGLQSVLRSSSLAEACALQWARSVERADEALTALPPSRVHRLSYESFVLRPAEELRRLLDFIGVPLADADPRQLVHSVSAHTIGKWKHDLTSHEVTAIEPIVRPQLARHGYA